MKRFGAFVLGGLLAAALALGAPVALAISEEQVISKLNSIPIFTIVDAKGAPLLVSPKNDRNLAFLNFYLDPQTVTDAFKTFQDRNPAFAKQSQIGVTSLGQVYKTLRVEAKKNPKLKFQFLSSTRDLKAALDLAKKQKPDLKNFNGVPVFFAVSGDKKGILTLKRDGKELLPIFFSEEDLQRSLDQMKQLRTDVPKQLAVQVATLDSVVGTMLSGKNDSDSQKITFVPSRSALNLARNIELQARSKAKAKPATKP